MKNKRAASAYKAQRNGKVFESYLEATCTHYRTKGIANITKTPEPLKPFGVLNKRKGWYKAYYEKKGEPDFLGTLKGGRSVMMEAKHTTTSNIAFDRIALQQERALKTQTRLGGLALVIVSFNLKRFYCVEWIDWIQLKELTGKKSVNEKDLSVFEVPIKNGIIDFLKGF